MNDQQGEERPRWTVWEKNVIALIHAFGMDETKVQSFTVSRPGMNYRGDFTVYSVDEQGKSPYVKSDGEVATHVVTRFARAAGGDIESASLTGSGPSTLDVTRRLLASTLNVAYKDHPLRKATTL